MTTLHRTALVGAALLLTAGSAFAQPAPPAADLTGDWTLQASAFPPEVPPGATQGLQPCDFEGTADVTQTEGALSGDASMSLVDGPQSCPPVMAATLTGEVVGNDVQMGMLMGGNLGTADFQGLIQVIGPAGATAGTMIQLSGNFQVTQGPFQGFFGTWSGVPGGPPPSVLEIPTLTAAGLAVLALLLLGAAIVQLFRRRAA